MALAATSGIGADAIRPGSAITSDGRTSRTPSTRSRLLRRAQAERKGADGAEDEDEARACHFFISSASFWMRPVNPPNSGGLGGGVFGFATVCG